MKKVLLATTAIVGASFVASAAMAKPEVRIAGFMEFQVGMTTQDVDRFGASPGGVAAVDNNRGYGFLTDSEVIVRASDKLDNGLAWSLKIEIETNTDDGSDVPTEASGADEVVLTLSGSWGQVFFGSEDGPADTMKIGGRTATRNAGTGGIAGDFRRWVGWDVVSGSAFWSNAGDPRETSDATKIAYITPRFAGFQAGVSFSPDRDEEGRYRDPDNNGSEQSFWEFGLNYNQKFGDFRVAAAGVAAMADNENTQLEDTRTWYVGAMVGYAGFSLGAGYGSNGDSRRPKTETNNEVIGWDVALGYDVGAWNFGVGYFRSESGVRNGSGDHELSVATVGATYDLGNGLSVYAEGVWFDVDGAAASGNGSTDNDGLALITGIGVEF